MIWYQVMFDYLMHIGEPNTGASLKFCFVGTYIWMVYVVLISQFDWIFTCNDVSARLLVL